MKPYITTALLALVLFSLNCKKNDPSPTSPPPQKKAHLVGYSWSINGATTHAVSYTSSSGHATHDSVTTNGFFNATLYSSDYFSLAVTGDAPAGYSISFTGTVMIDDTVYRTVINNTVQTGGVIISGSLQ